LKKAKVRLEKRQTSLEQRFDEINRHQLRTEILMENELIPNISLALENHTTFVESLNRVEKKVDCLTETVAVHSVQIAALTKQQMG